jgi:hypothetical protein
LWVCFAPQPCTGFCPPGDFPPDRAASGYPDRCPPAVEPAILRCDPGQTTCPRLQGFAPCWSPVT